MLAHERVSRAASEAEQVDTELNQTYQQLGRVLTSSAREQLRSSQRAWLAFVQLNRIALEATGQRLGFSPAEVERFEVDTVRLRIDELKKLIERSDADEVVSATFPQEDARLNSVYQKCLLRIPQTEEAKLRKAQRAWVAFRDASLPMGANVCSDITRDRTAQLSNVYLASGDSVPRPPAVVEAEGKPDPTVPDPFERAR